MRGSEKELTPVEEINWYDDLKICLACCSMGSVSGNWESNNNRVDQVVQRILAFVTPAYLETFRVPSKFDVKASVSSFFLEIFRRGTLALRPRSLSPLPTKTCSTNPVSTSPMCLCTLPGEAEPAEGT